MVHQANFKMRGFVERPTLMELTQTHVPVIVDLGSGLLDARTPWLREPTPIWLRQEPAVRQTLEAGAAVVTCSGDKLLGGPQAGKIAGRTDLVRACARHPLARAIRPGRLVLAALQRTLLAYVDRDLEHLPFWLMATMPLEQLEGRARAVALAPRAGYLRPAIRSLAVAPPRALRFPRQGWLGRLT